MAQSYTNLLTPNPAVPNLLKSSNPAQTPIQNALTNKTQPTWQSTLSQVQNFSNSLPKTTTPTSTGNQSMLPNTGGQTLLPSAIKTASSPISTPLITNQNNTNNTNTAQPITGNTTLSNGTVVNATTGALVSGPPQQQQNQEQNQQQNTTQNSTYPALVQSLANQQNTPANQSAMSAANAAGTLANNNPGTSGPAFDAYTQAVQNLNKIKAEQASQNAALEGSSLSAGYVGGREQVLQQKYASQLDAAQQAVNEQQAALGYQISGQQTQNTGYGTAGSIANTVQGQGQAALGTAAGYAAPQAGASYFGSPLTGGLVGSTGATGAVGGNSLLGSASTGNGLVDTSVQNALSQIRNGSSTTDAMSVLQGGAAGQQAFLNAMKQYDPNWSITSSNAIATQNMSQGATYQAQAQDLSNALQTMAPISQKLTSFMQTAGLSPNGVPLVNEQINKFNSQSNPAAVATMNSAIQDIRSYAIQILGSQSGANPTDITQSVNSFDFTNFTPTQLNTFFNNLNNLGSTRLSQIQSAMKSGYGNNNTTTPAAGITAADQGGLQSGGATPINSMPNSIKALAGATSSGISDIIKSLAGNSGAALAGGLAEKVLGL